MAHEVHLKNANRRYYRIADVVVRVESDLPITDGTFMPRFRLFETDGPGDDTITIRHHSVDSPMTPREFGLRVYRQPPWAVYEDGRSWIYVAIDDDDVPLKGGQVAVFSRDYSDGDIYTPDPRIFKRGGIQSITLMPSDQVLLAQCAHCFLSDLCDQCPARSWMESGTLDTPIEHYCRTSHRIARGLGLLGDAENAWDIPNWEKRIEEFVKRGGRNGPQG